MILPKRGLIVVRQSFDWSKVRSVDDLNPEKFDKLVGFSIGRTRSAIELWNNTFQKSFFEVRHLLKLISIQSFKAAQNTDIDLTGHRKEISRWRIVLLTDDDDWIKVDWLQSLPKQNSSIRFCRWQSIKFNGNIEVRENSEHFSYTNNYALYPLSRKYYKLKDLYQHGDQNRHHNLLSPPMIDYLNIPITITHKHPASAGMMNRLLSQTENGSQALYNSVERYLSRIDQLIIPEELSWITPFVEKSRHIFSSIL